MKALIIMVPFDSGHRDARMGRGPGDLVRHGAVERLQQAGWDVETIVAEPESDFTTEIGTAFELQRRVAQLVKTAIDSGSFPLILSGNCNIAAIGALAGIGSLRPSLVWFDGHADFCTPETAELGYLDGMGLAMATGRCWTGFTARIPGFSPIPDKRTFLVGAHEIEEQEGRDLRASEIVHIDADGIRNPNGEKRLAQACALLKPRTDAAYLHVDLDVHDATIARANHLAPSGGLAPDEVREAVCAVIDSLPVRVASLTAYDPHADSNGSMRKVALDLLSEIMQRAAARRA